MPKPIGRAQTRNLTKNEIIPKWKLMSSGTFTERSVLHFLLSRQEATVQQLSEQFHLPGSTVANIVTRLLGKGLIIRARERIQGRGRPAVTYRAALTGCAAVIHFDGHHVGGAVFDEHGEMLANEDSGLGRLDRVEEAVEIAKRVLDDMLRRARIRRQALAFVALWPNSLRTRRGTLSSSVLPWVSDDLVPALERDLGVQVRLVYSSMVMAELQHMDDPSLQCMIRFNVGDGVSSHAMIAGQIASGLNGLSGELGHITLDPTGPVCGCGKRGCVEAMTAGPAIQRAFRLARESASTATLLDARVLSGRSVRDVINHIWDCWTRGDALTRQLMSPLLDKLAWSLSVAMNLLDPDLVRIDGYVLRDRQAWIDELQSRLVPQLLRGDSRDIVIESARASLLDQQRFAIYQASADSLMTAIV